MGSFIERSDLVVLAVESFYAYAKWYLISLSPSLRIHSQLPSNDLQVYSVVVSRQRDIGIYENLENFNIHIRPMGNKDKLCY